ncbi:MAG: molecular chaperone DnaJ [Planctomycetia bacterium]|jgi:molecular chaperone DnaJ
MPTKRDYYEVLSVTRSASDGEIQTAYRKMAMQYHPDRNPGDEEAAQNFKEAAEAFGVLSNPEKRARYDRFGHAGVDENGGAPQFHDASDIFSAFGDVLNDFFGGGFGGGGRRRVRKGADIRCQIDITLEEAAKGTSKNIKFKRHKKCLNCHGSGARPGTQPERCNYCGGSGRVVQSTGIFSMQTTCPACHGAGTMIKDPCPNCNGSGYTKEDVTREVAIPAGVDSQTRLRLNGEGEPSPDGGPPGDCYCYINVLKHPLFERDDQNLICRIPITYSQATLGAEIDVPSLEGPKTFKIPPGTQVGDVFKMAGLGMPNPRHRGRGDLLVQVYIEVPHKVSKEEETLLRKLSELEHSNVSPQRKSFFEKVKEYFVPEEESKA